MNGDLNLTTQGGVSYLVRDADIVFNQATQLIPNQTTLGQGSAQAISQTESMIKEFGYFAQVEGNYKNQLVGTLGYRIDKSTLNGDPNKFYGFLRLPWQSICKILMDGVLKILINSNCELPMGKPVLLPVLGRYSHH